MAKNKAAKITSLGSYVYKNSRYKELDGLPTKGTLEQYIRIPLLSNIKDGVISKMSTVSMNGITCYRISEDADQTSVLDFGDNSITFMNCSQFQGDNIIGCFDPNIKTYSKEILNNVNMNYYGAGYPNLKGYSRFDRSDYSNFSAFFSEWALPSLGPVSFPKMYKPLDFSRNFYVGNNLLPLSAMYDSENDCFLLPEVRSSSGIYEKDTGVNDAFYPDKDCSFAYNIYKEGIGSMGLTPEGPENYMSTVFNGARENGFFYPDPDAKDSSCFITIYSYSLAGAANIYIRKDDVNNVVFDLNFNDIVFSEAQTLSTYAFIYDDENNDIYILTSGYNSDNKVLTYIFPVKACKNDIATGGAPSGISTDFDTNDFILSLLGSLIDEDKVPKPDDELFNDGGPDIDGAGDPYNTDEFNNIGSSVGGDADPGKDLNSVDATPNTSFNNFMQATGFFGSYVVSNEDLVEYTNTLKMLYSHADDVFFGEAAGLQADRITKNTIGLHMLPLTIPSTDYADTIFSMGNVGIAATDNYASYVAGNNYAHANYLTKLTRTFSVPLGTIKHNYDNFLDFAPYSSASLYIPYIGKVQLPINLVQSTSSDIRPLRLEFRVDYTSGDFMAILFCNIKGVDVALSHWNGNCARPVKVSVDDDSSAIIAGANRLASMFSFGASGSIGAQTSRGAGDFSSSSDPVSHNSMDFKNHTEGINSSYHEGHSAGKSASASFRMPSMPSSVTTNQHMIGNGTATGELGYLGIQDIVLTVERPIWWKPYDYGNLVGYPTKKVAKLASVKGFARISDAHIRCKATATEKNEIATLLSEGVIF